MKSMRIPIGPNEEIQALARSVFARQVQRVLNDADLSPGEKVERVKKLAKDTIGHVPVLPPAKAIEGLAKSTLACQIEVVVGQLGGYDTPKVEEIRALVEHFIAPTYR